MKKGITTAQKRLAAMMLLKSKHLYVVKHNETDASKINRHSPLVQPV